ncbi:MAG: endonuclease/exonuclease/phosphatase family protein [Campylobacterota bacterium]|nr:endonuclease/exonuclease/phosphatase family protein [Campylobacterota bacterium]
MFVPSLIYHQSCQSNCQLYLPDTFGMLCWNVYKKNNKHPDFHPFVGTLIEKKPIDLLLFQEANFKNNGTCVFPGFSFDAAANLELKGKFYGVLTAGKAKSENPQAYLSKEREGILGSHKSLLLCNYRFRDGTTLLVLNIHAINFRENQRYIEELDIIYSYVQKHEGPMIVSGDFNSWNAKRMQKLQGLKDLLSLRSVTFAESSSIKSFMGHQLDFIFYRGLDLLDSSVIDGQGLSDHNPLFAQFRSRKKAP